MTPCDVAVSKVSLLAWQTAVISFSTDPLNISLGCSPFNAYPRKKINHHYISKKQEISRYLHSKSIITIWESGIILKDVRPWPVNRTQIITILLRSFSFNINTEKLYFLFNYCYFIFKCNATVNSESFSPFTFLMFSKLRSWLLINSEQKSVKIVLNISQKIL